MAEGSAEAEGGGNRMMSRVLRLGGRGKKAQAAMQVASQAPADSALHDVLTGLPNRAYFTDALERCSIRAERQPDYRFAVLYLDLDRFKRINDTLGHAVGDELLISVARRLEVCVRGGDVVARMGGDEFTILLDDIENVRNATRVATEIEGMVSKPFKLTGVEISTGVSIGISLSSQGGTDMTQLVREADMALYRAKDAGRGRFEVFDAVMHAETVARMKLEAELRVAVEKKEFSLYYQPIIALGKREVVGFEALVRWHHPQRGTLSAEEFIGVADETGLILPLGRWILREACRQIALWQVHFDKDAPLTVSINMCTKELSTPGLVERLHNILKETALPPDCLRLEITEEFIMHNPELARTLLKQISDIGVLIQMDNFGQGYSSLTSLHNYPIHAIKIDGEFVAKAGTSGADNELVRVITSIADVLGMQVVAEGIETLEQLNAMKSLGCCQFGQGYYYSRPVAVDEATAILAAGGDVNALDPKNYGPQLKYARKTA